MINMINAIPAVETPMVVMTRRSLKRNDPREVLADSDICSFDGIDLSSGTSPAWVTVIRSGCFPSSTVSMFGEDVEC